MAVSENSNLVVIDKRNPQNLKQVYSYDFNGASKLGKAVQFRFSDFVFIGVRLIGGYAEQSLLSRFDVSDQTSVPFNHYKVSNSISSMVKSNFLISIQNDEKQILDGTNASSPGISSFLTPGYQGLASIFTHDSSFFVFSGDPFVVFVDPITHEMKHIDNSYGSAI